MRVAQPASRGFTLLELMLTITVAGVILGFAIPSLRQFILNNRMTGTANDLLVAIHTARTESIKRHVQTVLCFTSNHEAAEPPCDGDGSQGWIVFVDDLDPAVAAVTDNNVQVDTNEEVLLRHGPIDGTISLGSAPVGNAGYLAYSAAGFSRPIGAVGTDLDSVVLCDDRGNVATYGAANSTARGLSISATGRPAVTRAVADITALGGCP
jgi:type IV fimbrial biogenesis protein FimT